MLRILAISIILSASMIKSASGQNQNNQAWLGLEVDWDLGNQWTFMINPEYYTLYRGGSRWREVAFITGLSYNASPAFTFWGGFYTSYILQTENQNTYEFRPRVGARFNISRATNRFYAKVQSEYEWRFFWNLSDNEFSRSNRIRVRPDLLVSLFKENTVQDKNLCLRVYGEYFQNLDNNIEERFWNRFGTAVGLHYRLSPEWRYEIRYLVQGSKNTIEETRPSTVSHIVYLYVTYIIP